MFPFASALSAKIDQFERATRGRSKKLPPCRSRAKPHGAVPHTLPGKRGIANTGSLTGHSSVEDLLPPEAKGCELRDPGMEEGCSYQEDRGHNQQAEGAYSARAGLPVSADFA